MKIKLISLNCWLLPHPFSKENNERLDKLIKWIKKVDPDIITLQEVWMNSQISVLVKALNGYKHIISRSKLYNSTGLFTATKVDTRKYVTESFPPNFNLNPIELAARKGYQHIDFGEFNLINTHLYAPYLDKEKEIVERQVKMVCKVASDANKPVIVVGDFNIGLGNLKKVSNGTFKVVGDGNVNTVDKINPYTNMHFNRLGKTYDIIDHILMFGNSNGLKVKQKVIMEPVFSDHYALEATITMA